MGPTHGHVFTPSGVIQIGCAECLKKGCVEMKLIEIEKQRETKLTTARLQAGFYNIIDGQRAVATAKLSGINPATGEELATVPNIAAITLDDAVAAARNAFLSWHTVP